MTPKLWMLLGLGAVLALAGCATPDETAGDGTAGDGLGDGGASDLVTIGGRQYECDDAFDADGVCDEYELVESDATGTTGGTDGTGTTDGTGAGGGAEATADADGTVTVGGHAYVCEDQDNASVGDAGAGACEKYVLQSEA